MEIFLYLSQNFINYLIIRKIVHLFNRPNTICVKIILHFYRYFIFYIKNIILFWKHLLNVFFFFVSGPIKDNWRSLNTLKKTLKLRNCIVKVYPQVNIPRHKLRKKRKALNWTKNRTNNKQIWNNKYNTVQINKFTCNTWSKLYQWSNKMSNSDKRKKVSLTSVFV